MKNDEESTSSRNEEIKRNKTGRTRTVRNKEEEAVERESSATGSSIVSSSLLFPVAKTKNRRRWSFKETLGADGIERNYSNDYFFPHFDNRFRGMLNSDERRRKHESSGRVAPNSLSRSQTCFLATPRSRSREEVTGHT